MAFYRKTTPSSYPNTPASNFTDSSKNWRQHKNFYIRTDDLQTASLTAVPGRYTDSTRTWRRIKAMYIWNGSIWRKVFAKFAGQPYPEIPPYIRYDSYTGTDVVDFAMMGPGANAIAQGAAGTTYLWGRDGASWQNDTPLANRLRTFVFGSTPIPDTAAPITNDEGNFDGDKLRNTEAVIAQYDGKYIWYKDRITLTSGSSGTSYSQTVKIIKQPPVINSLAFKTDNTVTSGQLKYVSASVANEWYRSVNQATSVFKWYILDSQYETPTEAKRYGTTSFTSVVLTETTTTLTLEDYFNIPTTFNGVSTTGKWLHVQLICKNSSSDSSVDYTVAPYNDVTDYVVAQIGVEATVVAPTSLTSDVGTGNIVLTFSGGTGTQYDLFYANTNYKPTDKAAAADASNISSPYNASAATPGGLGLSFRNIERWFWVRKSTGSVYSNWFPAGAAGSSTGVYARLPLLAPYPPRTLTTSNITTTNITFNWLAPNAADSTHDAVVSYDYYVSTTNSIPATPTGNTTLNSISFPYTASSTPVTQYFWVKAKGASPDFATSTATGAISATPVALPNPRATGNMRRITMPIYFTNSSQSIWVGTNGYISLTVDPTSSPGTSWPTAGGVVIGPGVADMKQISLFTYSDSSNYYVRWRGHGYSETAGIVTLDYLVKFYWNSLTVDVYFITNTTTATLHPSSIYWETPPNVGSYDLWANSTSITGMTIPVGLVQNTTLPAETDDDRTAITVVAPAAPSGGTATVTPSTGTAGVTTYNASTSGWSGTAPITYSYAWQALNKYGLYWETLSSGSNATSFAPTVAQYNNAYSFMLVVTASNGILPNGTATASFTVNAPVTPVIPTVSIAANTNVAQTTGTINWTSTNQNSYSVNGTFASSANPDTTTRSVSKTGLTASTTYTGTITITSSTGNAATANYSLRTSDPAVAKLATPTGVTASDTRTDGVNITWNAVSGASYYGVWWGGAPAYDSTPDFGGPGNPTLITGTSYLDTAIGAGSSRDYYVQAFKTNNPTNTKSDWSSGDSGTRASAPATPAPVLSTLTANNSLTLGGTFSWSYTNSPTAYAILCTGPTGTVFTTSNAYTYTGTTFRPGYDGTGWQGAGTYTLYISATNGQNSVVSNLSWTMT
jgi:hypothetical protein